MNSSSNISSKSAKRERKLSVVIAGGGTGGHIFPAIAIANALKEMHPFMRILFVGAKGKMEMQRVPQAGYEIKGIDIDGFNRSSLLKNISLPFKLIKSFFQVKKIFKHFEPDAAIGVGGYSTFPVLRYAQRKHIPTFIHESNSFAGKSNILLGKKAVKVFVASEGMEKFFPEEKIIITGNPIRKNIINNQLSRDEALRFFRLDANKKTVLIIGGSLGARSINEAIVRHLPDFEAMQLQLIWQTGKTDAAKYISAGNVAENVWVGEFIQDIDKAYTAADVAVARAGAMTVAEICIAKLPAVLVPYPFAAEDHQTANAMRLVNKDAALIVKDNDVQTKLFGAIINLLMDDNKRKIFSENLGKLAVASADKLIAKQILETIE
ncbi:MAG: undecaprenyldiphospho-muramoylpentapeptide beta-N-acetylglucosaminyltransferase [Chitinophagaceae bacterium]|jgi:UDP-N-acetylglucosamine--N-acetylmuramyl-(pentapeptide) pyrophosphoryl-undecaprenol N-acetylglucosamine transferase|nr:undecaprenyldiphospho-muramoylpentapeptide beta-N-acetylglucosaminyltransferase [Chitinophagaceae bacterium]